MTYNSDVDLQNTKCLSNLKKLFKSFQNIEITNQPVVCSWDSHNSASLIDNYGPHI